MFKWWLQIRQFSWLLILLISKMDDRDFFQFPCKACAKGLVFDRCCAYLYQFNNGPNLLLLTFSRYSVFVLKGLSMISFAWRYPIVFIHCWIASKTYYSLMRTLSWASVIPHRVSASTSVVATPLLANSNGLPVIPLCAATSTASQ